MDFNRTNNPVLNGIETKIERNERAYVTGETTTFSGIATKTGILLLIVIAVAALIWSGINNGTIGEGLIMPLFFGSMIISFVAVLASSFSRGAKPFFVVLYAVSEGVLLGVFSLIAAMIVGGPEGLAKGIVLNAILITFGIFAFLLVIYASGLFKVGSRFRKIVYTISFGILFFLLINLVLSFFGASILNSASPGLLLIFSAGMIILGSFYLLIDFDNCKRAVDSYLPKQYEWQLSLGLLVSLVFVYIYVLRLLIILAGRRR